VYECLAFYMAYRSSASIAGVVKAECLHYCQQQHKAAQPKL